MKKLITLTFVITALLLGATAIQAQPYKYKKAKAVKKYKKNHYGQNIGNNKGFYNRNGVYVYHMTKNQWKYGRKYKNTYKVKIFPNGRKKVKLVNSVLIKRHRLNSYYQTRTIRQGWRLYRVTYKITQYPSGYVRKTIINKKRLYSYW